jgi:cytochrome c5
MVGSGLVVRTWLLLVAITALLLFSLPGYAQPVCGWRAEIAKHPGTQWSDLRAACMKEVRAYEASDPRGFAWFLNAGNGFVGVPLLLQIAFPDLAPEIWGPSDEHFARFGLFMDPEEPARPLPRGLGITSTAGRPAASSASPTSEIDFAQPGLDVVTLSCGSCHTGQVHVGSGMMISDGAPNTQFDVRKWREAYELTVERYLSDEENVAGAAKRIAAIIDGKPPGTLYPASYFKAPSFANFNSSVEATQRAVFKAQLLPILTSFAAGTRARSLGVTLEQHTSYGNWNAPGLGGFSSGQQDGSGDLIVQLLAASAATAPDFNPAVFLVTRFSALPPFATPTDIPSVWNQQQRDLAQWDGTVRMPFWRNLAAQLPIVGVPDQIDLVNTGLVANFLHGLPPAPYPFHVDMARAARGEQVFASNCAACHRPHNDTVYNEREIGTDMNRAQVLNGPALKLFLAGFTASCHDKDFQYTEPSGQTVLPCQMQGADIIADRTTPDTQGYVTSVLDGVWARAPYLHNGSVPSMRQLLIPAERATTFLRGAVTYDEADMGYSWDVAQTGRLSDAAPTLMLYDTRRDGNSNRGHDRDVVIDGKLLRLNWSGPSNAEAVADLIEYLKTQ